MDAHAAMPMTSTAEPQTTAAPIEHVVLDERGVAWIKDANTKVVEVALDKIAYGWSAEEIHAQHPNLSMAQIHAGLAYYYDHRSAMDGQIDRGLREADALRAATGKSPLEKKLRMAGRLP